MRIGVTLSIWFALGCGEVVPGPDVTPGPADPFATSGTRLKLRHFASDDGAKQFIGLHDADRKEDCEITPAIDGKSYCLPAAMNAYFSDDQCTRPLGSWFRDTTCPRPAPAYIYDYTIIGCETAQTAKMYQRGAQVSVNQYWFRSGVGGVCLGPFDPTGYDVFAVGPEVPLATFVAIGQTTQATTGRLAIRTSDSADGMHYPMAARDATIDDDCSFGSANLNTGAAGGQCTPFATASANYYSDSQCSQPVTGYPKSCPKPKYAQLNAPATCPGEPTKIYRLGNAAGSSLFVLSGMVGGTACTSTMSQPDESTAALGQPLALVATQRSMVAAPGHRLQPMHQVGPGIDWTYDERLFDTTKNTECSFSKLADGSTRCMPPPSGYTSYFTNNACNVPIDLFEQPVGGVSCTPPAVPAFSAKQVSNTTCPPTLEYHTVGARHLAAVFELTPQGCRTHDTSRSVLYDIGPAVPNAEFATGTAMIDP